MIYYANGSPDTVLSAADLRSGVHQALDAVGRRRKVLIVPPDITRLQSRAGELTRCIYEYMPDAVTAILPALGTHLPMNGSELTEMFGGGIPRHLFLDHRWRIDCLQAGVIPGEYIGNVSDGCVSYDLPVLFNRMLLEQQWDCIFSVSQVVPHEVAGMAGYTKNLVVGCGGAENIHKTHFLAAVYGMERIIGRADSPVRKVLNHAAVTFLGQLPIVHIITVLGMDAGGVLRVRGLFIGDDDDCFHKASALSRLVNVHQLDKPLKKAVVYLDPVEYKSTWLGNKSIYRTRMAIADGGELLVMAPGVKMFGEDREIDRLIRVFGYRGTPATMAAIDNKPYLRGNLSAAAHLIHGSSEGRFTITYCTGGLSRTEIEGVGFNYAPVDDMLRRYNPEFLSEGYNTLSNGEEIYYISSPGTGLWAWREKFERLE